MPGGAPVGNDNATRGTQWRDAIQRAVDAWPEECETGKNDKMKGLNTVAHAFVAKMMESNDIGFFKEFGDRVEGKPRQSIEVSGGHAPIQTITRKIVSDKLTD